MQVSCNNIHLPACREPSHATQASHQNTPPTREGKRGSQTLYYSGHAIADAARMVGVTETAARQWVTREGWRQEIQQAQQFVEKSSGKVALPRQIAIDTATLNRESRSLLAKAANLTARHVAKEAQADAESIFARSDKFKALVESTAKIDGTWEDSGGQKLAVAININAIAHDPTKVRALTEAEVKELEAQGYEVD